MLIALCSLALAGPIVDVGVGVRNAANDFISPTLGLRPAARVMLAEWVGVEAGLYVALPGTKPSNLTNTLVAIAYESDTNTTFRQPCPKEVGSLEALAVLSPWAMPSEGGVTLWPSAVAGFDGLLIADQAATVSDAYISGAGGDAAAISTAGAPGLNVGVTGGLAFEATVENRVVIRLLGVWRAYLDEEPDYGNVDASGQSVQLNSRVYVAPAASLDVLVRL